MLNMQSENKQSIPSDEFGQLQKLWFLVSRAKEQEHQAAGTVRRYTCCSHPDCIRGSGALKKALIQEGRELGLDLEVSETPTICGGACAGGPYIGLPEVRLFYGNVQASEAYDLIYETSLEGHLVFSKLLLDPTKVTDSRVLFDEEENLLVLIEPGHCLVEAVEYLFRFNGRESCGKCFPCRFGVHKLAGLLQKVRQGAAKQAELEAIRKTAAAMARDAYCHFGAKVTAPLRLVLEQKPEVFEKHLEKGCGPEELHLMSKERG
jgi:(2Fe-2S) ferredoxin